MGEGEPAPAPAAPGPVIKIFISGNSGSKEVFILFNSENIYYHVKRNNLDILAFPGQKYNWQSAISQADRNPNKNLSKYCYLVFSDYKQPT